MIPNLAHFVWITGPNSRDFSFINYLAVRCAHDHIVGNGGRVTIWCNEEPKDNPLWERAKQYAQVRQVAAPVEHNGVPLSSPQYQSDVLRLHILFANGGIYLDTDTLLTAPLGRYMRDRCVMSVDSAERNALSAGLIMAEAGHPFIQRWLQEMKPDGDWAAHATAMPFRLLQEMEPDVTLADYRDFIPFDWRDKGILDEAGYKLPQICAAIHVWETIWGPDLQQVNDYWLRHSTSKFANLFRKYAWTPKIVVYAIAKNEEQFVERFCKSAEDADRIVIVDTGSSDKTVKLAHQHGAAVPQICVSPWRFDIARNAALSLLPADYDICVSLDLDEELQPGWRDAIEKAWVWGTTRLKYKFDWGVGIVFYYEKIHARHGYRWHHPCHEYPVPDRITERWATTDELLVVHKPDPSKSRGQYLDLLRVSVEEDPQCPRNAFYYARELSFHGKHEEAIAECKRYLDLPRATWDGERCYAKRTIGRCLFEMGHKDRAWTAFMEAMMEAPGTREPWAELAKLAHDLHRWKDCYWAATKGLEITDRLAVYTCDPEVWGTILHEYAAFAAWNLGLKSEAVKHMQDAAAKAPDNQWIRDHLDFYVANIG